MAIIGIILTIISILVALGFGILTLLRPKIRYASAKASLSRCLIDQLFENGWGIIETWGKLRVSHKFVTIIDSKLSYLMDEKYTSGKTLESMGDTFPPLYFFERVGNDEAASIPAFPRELFTTIKLSPGNGEQEFNIQFVLGGNFAKEFSTLFFQGALSTIGGMFLPLKIRFQYEYNGGFYWTPDFDIPCAVFSNKGWTKNGLRHIDKNGDVLELRYKSTP